MKHFLERLGANLLKALKFALPVIQTVAPVIPGGALGRIAGFVGLIENVGEQVKSAGGAKLDKLEAILPHVREILEGSELLTGKKIVDPARFEQAAKEITNGVVDLLKAVDEQ